MTEITQEGWKNKALSMLLAQLTSYVLLIAATVIPSPGTVPIIPLIIAALTLAAFVVFWPFRGSMLDRIVTLVFGAISLIFVTVPFPTGKVPPDQTAADGSTLPWYSWALAMGLLLVMLVVFSFGTSDGPREAGPSYPRTLSRRDFRCGGSRRGRLVLPA